MKRNKSRIFFKLIGKIFFGLLLLFSFVLTLFYINTTIYNFPEPTKFAGNKLFNPYQNLPPESYRANFHAHTVAWSKVTNGHNSEKEMFEAYSAKGYDIVGISNYHKISTYSKDKTDLFVPVYEHGYNIFKSHCLAINTDDVSYFDYPLLQSTSHKQKIIENIKANNGMVTIAHPKFAGGKTLTDMEKLVHYEFVEVLNHYRKSDKYWDAALSSGRLSWVMGNDDTHDLVNEATFQIWNIIHSETRSSEAIIGAMKIGKSYAVDSRTGALDNRLKSLQLKGDNGFTLITDTIADSIQIIGDQGRPLITFLKSDSVSYDFEANDTYARAVVFNKNSDLYLNPIIRYDGSTVPLNANVLPSINRLWTWLIRLGFICLAFTILIGFRKVVLK